MKEFCEETICEKCGFPQWEILVEYKTGIFDRFVQEDISTARFGDPIDEYLLRTCGRCGYKWPEMTTDKHPEME